MEGHIWAIAELKWATENEGYNKWPIRGNLLCSPAEFECDKEYLWSVCIYLAGEVFPGQVTVLPVTTLMSEAREKLLFVGSSFRVTYNGTNTIATGRVTELERLTDEQHAVRWRS